SIWPDLTNPLFLQTVSWITFLALFITPGYLLAELLTRRLDLDWLERSALAFPLGVAVMAVPGLAALLLHRTLVELTAGWVIASALVIIVWIFHWSRRQLAPPQPPAQSTPWTTDEWLLLGLLVAAFAYSLPLLNLPKIDGDAYAVGSFAADALAGLPLNAREPLFGTLLGPGVRMAFNQSLPMAYLWSYLAHIDPITLTATASRAVVALWILLAAYTLGKAAGVSRFGAVHGRRVGLLMAALQMLIFLAAPFLRGDNVSLFFFERTTADKFMVPATMLPVLFALAMRTLAGGGAGAWWAAALVTFAVSTIHPLIAAMVALALTAFAGLHWLLNLRQKTVFLRSLALGGLVIVAMALPIVQLVLAQGEAPLAPSYPQSIATWPVGYKKVAALPWLYLPTLEMVGPLPDLTQLQAGDADTLTNPFLVWRFAVNMNRRRLLLFDLNHYISDPNIFLEPPYLLALLLLPLLFWKLRTNLAAQFAVGVTLAILFVMFNPWLTPLIGGLVMPWILWRFVWLLPYTLIMALVLYAVLRRLLGGRRPNSARVAWGVRWAPFTVVVLLGLGAGPLIRQNLQIITDRAASPYNLPAPTRLFAQLQTLTAARPAVVLADPEISITLPAYVANAHIVAHRMPTTSEIFPATRQGDALQRLIDQARFFRARLLTAEMVEILARYGVGFVITASGSDLDLQLRSATPWFTLHGDEDGYSLYAVRQLPTATAVINGNTALAQRLWAAAENFYTTALQANPHDALAVLGLAELAHVQGQFTPAIARLQTAVANADQPVFHYRLGQIYLELGQFEQSRTEFQQALKAAPDLARFHTALADACLGAGDNDCAAEHLAAAVATRRLPDAATRTVALADLWRQRGQTERAVALYEQAVALRPSVDYQLMLASVYQAAGRLDAAATLLDTVRLAHPLSVEALTLTAGVRAQQGANDPAQVLYEHAIWLQEGQGLDAAPTRLALAQLWLDSDELDAARHEIDTVLALQPNNPTAYSLRGDLYLQQGETAAATEAYQQAFRLNPTRVSAYLALTNQLRSVGGRQDEMAALLQRAIKANPDEAILALALGDSLEQQGETGGAVDAYQTALNLLETSTLPTTRNGRARAISRAYAYTRLAGVSQEVG
ncbi:MAG: tetratricopeptide repeat protein, partial [Chloroflexota bacterium]|nr:tetratricopeptide repeat protein [Chloroflexota bacterium]